MTKDETKAFGAHKERLNVGETMKRGGYNQAHRQIEEGCED